MKRRIDLICAFYMFLILCLSGLLCFVLYQQKQVIEEQRQYIQGLLKQDLEMGDSFTIEKDGWIEYAELPPVTEEITNTISQQSAIKILEYCRNIHADIAGNEAQLDGLNNAGFSSSASDHEEWVRIYEDLIRYVKAK